MCVCGGGGGVAGSIAHKGTISTQMIAMSVRYSDLGRTPSPACLKAFAHTSCESHHVWG